jgi:hypothetical protein
VRRRQRALGEVEAPQPHQHREQQRRFPSFLAQLARPTVGGNDLGRGVALGRHQRHAERVLERELETDSLEAVGQRCELRESLLQVSDGLAVGTPSERVFARVVVILRGAPGVVAAREVHGELGGALSRPRPQAGLEAVADPPVYPGETSRRHALVEHLLVERVPKTVAGGQRAIRPLHSAARLQGQVLADEGAASLLDGVDVMAAGGPDGGRRPFDAGHARGFEKRVVLGRETGELGLDQLAQAFRNPRGPRLDPLSQSLSRHVVHQADHEEGVAVGAPVDERRQLAGEGCAEVQDLEHLGAQEGGPVDPLERIEVGVERAVSEDVSHRGPSLAS